MRTTPKKKTTQKKYKKTKLTNYGYSRHAFEGHTWPEPRPVTYHDGVPLMEPTALTEAPTPPKIHNGVSLTRPTALDETDMSQFLIENILNESNTPEGRSR